MAVPEVGYLVFGANSAPVLPMFGRPRMPSGAHDLDPPLLAFAVAPHGRDSACQWLAAVPQDRWVFIVAQSRDEARWLAGHTRAQVAYADAITAALIPGGLTQTQYGPMLTPGALEQAYQAAAAKWNDIAVRLAEAKADRDTEPAVS